MRFPICFVAAWLLGSGISHARQDPHVLPDIAPREFEIRGALEISFPTLQRQPLTGFNPPPRLYQIPSDRMPDVGAYKQHAADLPASPMPRPDPPVHTRMVTGEPNRMTIEAGAGRYFSRLVQGWVNAPITEGVTVMSDVRYNGTNGHRPLPEENTELRAPYQTFKGRAGVHAIRNAFSGRVELDGFSDQYTLYGADLFPSFAAMGWNPQPARSGNGIGTSVLLRTGESVRVPAQVNARYGLTNYATSLLADASNPELELSRLERRLDLGGSLTLPVGERAVVVDLAHTTAGLDTISAFSGDYSVLQAAATARFRQGDVLHVQAGARYVGFETGAHNPATVEQARYLLPHVQVDLYAPQGLHVYLKNVPRVEARGMADLFRENPYAMDAPAIMPTVHFLDLQGGAAWYMGPFRMAAHVGLQQLEHMLYFEETRTPPFEGFRRGIFEAHYGKARIMHAGGNVSLLLPSGFRATAQASVRTGRLTELDTSIPYFAPIVGETQLSYRFLDGKALVQLTGTYEDRRFTNREETAEIAGFFDLDAKASYNFQERMAVFLQLNNMGPGSRFARWANYTQPRYVGLGGIRFVL